MGMNYEINEFGEIIRTKTEVSDNDLKQYEEAILRGAKVRAQIRQKVATGTRNRDVLWICVKDSAITVVMAAKWNPFLTPEMKQVIAQREMAHKQQNSSAAKQHPIRNVEVNTPISASIQDVRVEYDVVQNAEKGMRIWVDFHVSGMANRRGAVNAYFFRENKGRLSMLVNCDAKYYAVNGQVSAGNFFIPAQSNEQFLNFPLFLPYDELHLAKGQHSLSFTIEIFDHRAQSIANSGAKNFFLTMNRDSLYGVHEANQPPKGGCLGVLVTALFVGASAVASLFSFIGLLFGL